MVFPVGLLPQARGRDSTEMVALDISLNEEEYNYTYYTYNMIEVGVDEINCV